jgi:general L-amino acid transport system substrate-binding protein
MRSFKLLAVGVALGIAAVGGAAKADTLSDVEKRGIVICGVNNGLTGFAIPDDQGHWRGLSVDVCRAIASAIFGDDTKVKYAPLGTKERFTALQSGEIDLLARESTWTFSRENELGLEFVAIDFYDGQGFMVRKELGVDSALKLSGATICVQTGTTTEKNLADWFQANKLELKTVVFQTSD